MYRTDFWTLGEGEGGMFWKNSMYIIYRSPAQVGCIRQVLGPGALGRPRGIGWRGRWEGGSGWGIHVTPRLIHVNVWPNPLQCCEVISLQLINEKKKKKKENEKWKWSHSVTSDSYPPHGLQPTRLLHSWDFPGKSSGVGCHCLLHPIKPLYNLILVWWCYLFFLYL